MIPNEVKRDLAYFFTELFRGVHDAADKDKFESANVLIIFILPMMERSLWDHIFNVFFKDPNLSKTFFFSNTSTCRSYVKCTPSALTGSPYIWRYSMVSFLWRIQPSHSISDFV